MSGAVDRAPDCAGRNGAHTPPLANISGKWVEVVKVDEGFFRRLINALREATDTFKFRMSSDSWRHVETVDEDRIREWRDKAEANARLIAAAPDLLAACINLVGHTKWVAVEFDIHYAHLAEAEAAIAKAEGRPNA